MSDPADEVKILRANLDYTDALLEDLGALIETYVDAKQRREFFMIAQKIGNMYAFTNGYATGQFFRLKDLENKREG